MPRIYPDGIKQKALELRKQGYMYSEIQKNIGYSIPKSTFTNWFKNAVLSSDSKQRLVNKIRESGTPGRVIAWQNIRKKRADLLKNIYHKVERFWSKLTSIPLDQFNKPWKDKRTAEKPTRRVNYKGVLAIYYFSNSVFLELKFISDIIYNRLVKGL